MKKKLKQEHLLDEFGERRGKVQKSRKWDKKKTHQKERRSWKKDYAEKTDNQELSVPQED